ncbi:hypothetical protein BWD09_11970 [Neisseria dentiae]|uniref:Uncharacterized protein n=1 Tax=Neisseria dentiae TaxID=194197 RepID=A0A1X3D2C6_9NEIS|nr:hypothetical protein BWD09_11970 [Neisseria dentiae]
MVIGLEAIIGENGYQVLIQVKLPNIGAGNLLCRVRITGGEGGADSVIIAFFAQICCAGLGECRRPRCGGIFGLNPLRQPSDYTPPARGRLKPMDIV